MPLSRTEVLDGTVQELANFEDLIRSIDAAGWDTPSRCDGWTVGDVCRHVTGTIAAIAAARFDDLVGPDATARQVAERQGASPTQLADELHNSMKAVNDIVATIDDAVFAGPPPVDVPGTMGFAVEAIWYDAWLHGEDIRTALGRASAAGPGLKAAVSHVTDTLRTRDFGPATIKLDGYPPLLFGDGGATVATDATAFVLAATGRLDPTTVGLDASVNIYA
jgi:uncharacterized protein (TIGR03083 family)